MRRPSSLAAAGVLAVALTGCADTIDRKDLESKLSSFLQLEFGSKVPVSCPSGQASSAGKQFNCTIKTPNGRKATVRIRLNDDHGKFSVVKITPG